ncbi:MAG TPA: dihydroneopterin aldolase, partial [Bacteroidales bacterium]|nr:dihydroneopterin aldolase [Bacteroidales bacterium]
VDYSRVYELVAAEMLRSSLLLEHVAGRIIRAVTAEFALEDCVVTVSKLTPAVGGQVGRASVTLSMKELNNGQS